MYARARSFGIANEEMHRKAKKNLFCEYCSLMTCLDLYENKTQYRVLMRYTGRHITCKNMFQI